MIPVSMVATRWMRCLCRIGHSSWMQTEDIAFIYRAYATYDNPLKITSPGPCGPGTPALDPGSNVPTFTFT